MSDNPGNEEQPRPLLCVVRGTPSDEELAALTAVLAAAASHGPADTPPPRGSAWAAPAARLRTSLRPGPSAWRASALPR
ncbi:MAG: acyl-CoA carboxylase subunit epsilon [Actinomycetota bacterium]|nr:acyl-CoA carboxylase subunit epsilon [Actinomycetota bacterium]